MLAVERDRHLRAHVRGFTKCHPAIRDDLRGTYVVLASDDAIVHLSALGVTAVELLAVHHIIDEVATSSIEGCELLGLQHDRLLRAARPGTRRPATWASRLLEFKRW